MAQRAHLPENDQWVFNWGFIFSRAIVCEYNARQKGYDDCATDWHNAIELYEAKKTYALNAFTIPISN